MPITHVWRLVDQWRAQQRFPVTQAALARDIGVNRTALSQWKLGQTRPTPDNLRALQSATGIRYRDLTDALLRDMGYLPAEYDDDTAATSRAPGSGAQVHHLDQAAHDGTPATEHNRKIRAEQERALGEESQDEGDA